MRLAAIHRYPVKSLGGETLDRANVEQLGLEGDRRFMLVTPAGQFVTAREVPKLLLHRAAYRDGSIRLTAATGETIHLAFPDTSAARMMVRVWRSEVPARVAPQPVNRWLSDGLGADVRLVYLADPSARTVNPDFGGPNDTVSFADGYPLLLASSSSLDNLNGRLAERSMGLGPSAEMLRFRPNVVIEGAPPWDEDCWRIVQIGAIPFRVVKPCERCVVTTLDPATAGRSIENEPLRTLGTFRRDKAGRIMFGQNLIPLETGTIAVGDPVEVIERGPSMLT